MAASSDANPGDVFYPVKRTKEQVQLAFEFSPKDKAQLHLVLADRRAQEMEWVAEKGNVAHLEPLQRDLQRNLEAVTAIVSALEDLDSVADLNTRLESNASATLADLQIALSRAPESVQKEVASVLAASGIAFSEAVEAVGAKAPHAPGQSNEPGLLEIRVSIPPPSGVEHAYIEMAGIQAFRVHPRGGQWIDVSTETYIFDLVDVAEVQRILAEQEVPPGPYSQVRFRVTRATVIANGMEHEIQAPPGQITLRRPFKVEPGKTTTILLDFDGPQTLHQTAQDQFVLDPQVGVQALEPEHQNRLLAQEIRKLEQKAKNEVQSPAGAPPLPRIAVEGVVEKVEGDKIFIGGKSIKLPTGVAASVEISPGQDIRIEAGIQRDGSLEISRVAPAPPPRRPVPTSRPQGRPSNPGAGSRPGDQQREGNAPSSKPSQPAANVVRFSGVVRSMNAQVWIIGNRAIHVGDQTNIEGEVAIGSRVSVAGVVRSGRVVSSSITKQETAANSPEPTPSPPEPQSQAPRPQGADVAQASFSGDEPEGTGDADNTDRPTSAAAAGLQQNRQSYQGASLRRLTLTDQPAGTELSATSATTTERPEGSDTRELPGKAKAAEAEPTNHQTAANTQSNQRNGGGDREAIVSGEKKQAKQAQAGSQG